METGACGDASSSTDQTKTKFINLIVLGMAGTGKTTFVHRLATHLHAKGTPPYVVNLDPACRDIPYPCNIDIRDTVKYKDVMETYKLGPNGAIVTSLNLFATKFDQVINLIEQKRGNIEYVIFDTPGQIEVFTWSASGTIITETLASQFTTVIVYVMDTERNTRPTTFMSNMLYACSILYKSRLPFIIVFNKTDVKNCEFAKTWMTDFMAFDEALDSDKSYVSSLNRSLCLVLDEFYANLSCVGVSSVSGEGVDEFFEVVDAKEKEYLEDYKVEYEKLKAKMKDERVKKGERELERVKKDFGGGDEVVMQPLMGNERVELDVVLKVDEDDEEEEEEVDKEDMEEREDESFRKSLKSCKK
uniref:GPN-loop GTPase n=1 Tax=Strigamia maritima TaxID=126957 RepID=T1IR87_STRMM